VKAKVDVDIEKEYFSSREERFELVGGKSGLGFDSICA
jgi:hypothetical protein